MQRAWDRIHRSKVCMDSVPRNLIKKINYYIAIKKGNDSETDWLRSSAFPKGIYRIYNPADFASYYAQHNSAWNWNKAAQYIHLSPRERGILSVRDMISKEGNSILHSNRSTKQTRYHIRWWWFADKAQTPCRIHGGGGTNVAYDLSEKIAQIPDSTSLFNIRPGPVAGTNSNASGPVRKR